MPNLTVLDMRTSVLFDPDKLTSLNKFENLEVLNLNNTILDSIEALGNLTNLKTLSLDETYLDQISGLDKLKKLEILSLLENDIPEIEGLEGLTNLRYLNLSKNPISKIEGLEGLKNIEIIHLGYTEITTVEKEHFKGIAKDCIVNFGVGDAFKSIDKELPSNITIAYEYHEYGNYSCDTEEVDKFMDAAKARLIEDIKKQEMSSQL
ncbi:leucine-rich repeat domain-containing protein [Flavobacterium oreochromis]|nr:leucine-rich repeat domain-containing protein [Flavobacterium oreochromis]QYS85532.1 leucine-rich repeat domain-containing protein [Flavobacterium oreochromis]